MTPEDWEVLNAYIEARRNDLWLADWGFTVRHDPPSSASAMAEIRPTYGRRHATVRFCSDFRELSAAEQRHVVVHELIHCHLAQIQHLTSSDSGIGKALGTAGHPVLDAVAMAIEHAVDSLADVIAPNLPLIEWTTEEPTRETSVNTPYEGPIDDPRAE